MITFREIAIALQRAEPEPGSAEAEQWSMWIQDAYLLIEARLGCIDDIDENRLDYVVREAVTAQVRRPDDATSVSVSVDDGSVSKQYRSSRGRVTILDEWWEFLRPTGGKRAFQLDLGPTLRVGNHVPWCNLNMGATYCSCGASLTRAEPLWEC